MLHGSGNMYQNTDLWFLKQDALDLMHSHGIFPVPSSQPVSLNLRNPDILLFGSHGKYGNGSLLHEYLFRVCGNSEDPVHACRGASGVRCRSGSQRRFVSHDGLEVICREIFIAK